MLHNLAVVNNQPPTESPASWLCSAYASSSAAAPPYPSACSATSSSFSSVYDLSAIRRRQISWSVASLCFFWALSSDFRTQPQHREPLLHYSIRCPNAWRPSAYLHRSTIVSKSGWKRENGVWGIEEGRTNDLGAERLCLNNILRVRG